ncbi:gamma-tubulin complex component protein, partial [Chytridium lagenaria]
LAEQECLIMEDILFVLLGIDGKYISPINSPKNAEDKYRLCEFKIDPSLDPSLADLTRRIVAAAAHYTRVQHFMDTHSRFEFGRVAHALVAAIRDVVKDYLILVAQLEHQVHFAPSFGIHKLWFHVSPSLHILEALSRLVEEVHAAEGVGRDESEITMLRTVNHEMHGASRGGVVVGMGGLVKQFSIFGFFFLDPVIKQLHLHLLERALIPYLETLRRWIHHGEIRDPCDEFLIQERRLHLTKDQVNSDDFSDVYWDQRYVFRRDGMPPFLEGVMADRILRAGKYLNVVRECGIDVVDVEERVVKEETGGVDGDGISSMAAFGDIVKVMDGGKIVDDIDKAYRFANQTLLELLMKDRHLINRMRSIKHYFLLDQSDYLTQFLDIADPELRKPRKEVSIDRLKSILELAIRNPGSAASAADIYKDDLTVEMSPYSLVDQLLRVASVGEGAEEMGVSAHTALAGSSAERGKLKGIDSLMLGYKVGFPVSLVFNRKVMTKYQLLFRHLLRCKHLERLLCASWADEEEERYWKDEKEVEAFAGRMGAVRARMLHFVQQVINFTCGDVIDPLGDDLRRGWGKSVMTVDEVLKLHDDFLDSCLKDAMLTSPKLLKVRLYIFFHMLASSGFWYMIYTILTNF